MFDLKELYRQVLMDHFRNPRHKGLVNNKSYANVFLTNPGCGDEITMQLKIESGKIIDIKHDGKGCSVCCASASICCERLINIDISEANRVINEFYKMIKGIQFDQSLINKDELSLSGVSQIPARINCASLAWKACEKVLSSKDNSNE